MEEEVLQLSERAAAYTCIVPVLSLIAIRV